MKEKFRKRLLELIKKETDMYSYQEVVNNNYSIEELIEILETLIKYNKRESE